MLGCIQPMSSPIMKRMLGLPAGACANAGGLNAGKLIAARVTVEASSVPNRLLIFMIQILHYDSRCKIGQNSIARAATQTRTRPPLPPSSRPCASNDLPIFPMLLRARYAISAEFCCEAAFSSNVSMSRTAFRQRQRGRPPRTDQAPESDDFEQFLRHLSPAHRHVVMPNAPGSIVATTGIAS